MYVGGVNIKQATQQTRLMDAGQSSGTEVSGVSAGTRLDTVVRQGSKRNKQYLNILHTGWAKKSVTLFSANFSALVKYTKMKL